MNAHKHLPLPIDDGDAPATVLAHAMAFARTLGTKLRVCPASDDDQGDIALENLRGRNPSIEDAGGLSHQKIGAPSGTPARAIPPLYTLDAFADTLAASEGVDLLDLPPMTTLAVRTANSAYRILVLQDTTVLVQGGCCFPEATIAHLRGSGCGGHLLKLAWIGVGLRMEFLVDGRRLVTSTVRAIVAEGDPETDGSASPPRRSSYHR